MTTAVKIPYSDASPAQLRDAILPEERDQFDAGFQRALAAVGETLSLEPLEEFLAHWRRLAWAQNHDGHDAWRLVLARADYTLATGKMAPAGLTVQELRDAIERYHAGQSGS